nr:signal peptidase I [Shewanella dokdonensis]
MLLGYAVGQVTSSSMEPTLKLKDSVVYKTSWLNLHRNDIIIALKVPKQNGGGFINVSKRIAAIPGDKVFICDYNVYVNGVPFYKDSDRNVDCVHVENIALESDEYYLLGENKFASYDSRFFGVINRESISAIAIYKVSEDLTVTYF